MYGNLKKKYGQNFLIDNNILRKIANLTSLNKLNVLEIGPGNGKLTDELLIKDPLKLTLVEIDKDLIADLTMKYNKYEFIKIINENILNIKFNLQYELVISNLPYNISSQILVKLSIMDKPPNKLILMFQKEFANRLLDKKINSINSIVKCFYDVRLCFHVSKTCFRPIPKVDSSVLIFSKRKEALLKIHEIDNFINFKRKLFSHKRKSLKNLLKEHNLSEKFDLNLRVENLDLQSLINIFRVINS